MVNVVGEASSVHTMLGEISSTLLTERDGPHPLGILKSLKWAAIFEC